MDESELEKLKKESEVDNSRLEEIMTREITPEMQMEFFEVLKESRLFMPVTFSENIFKGIENAKEGDVIESDGSAGFDINYLTDNDGNRAVPLFTSSEKMEETGIRSSVYVLYMSDLAEMLKQTDRYTTVAINPLTDHDIFIPIEGFLSIFHEISEDEEKFMKSISELLEVLEKHSVELEENSTLILRNDENLMVENAEDGVFTARVPFYASSNPKYREDLKYTNILLMPKSKKILPLGPNRELDIVIAPGTQFKLEDSLDEFTTLWMCGDQPFYDE